MFILVVSHSNCIILILLEILPPTPPHWCVCFLLCLYFLQLQRIELFQSPYWRLFNNRGCGCGLGNIQGLHTHPVWLQMCFLLTVAAALARGSSLQPPPALALLCLYVPWMAFTSTQYPPGDYLHVIHDVLCFCSRESSQGQKSLANSNCIVISICHVM